VLPVLFGVQEVTLNAGEQPVCKEVSATRNTVAKQWDELPAKRQPMNNVEDATDEPVVVANVYPDAQQPRGAPKHTPRSKVRAGGAAMAAARELAQPASVHVDLQTRPLRPEWGYVFAVEAKHTQGVAGGEAQWSARVFSDLVLFDHPQRELKVQVGARFGGLVWHGEVNVAAKPTDITVGVESKLIDHIGQLPPEQRRDFAGPYRDAWPEANTADVFAMKPPPRGPRDDDLRPS